MAESGVKMAKTCHLSTVLLVDGGYTAPALVTERGCSKIQKLDELETRRQDIQIGTRYS